MSLAFPDFDEGWTEYNMSHVHIIVSYLHSSDVFAISTWTASISDMSPKKMFFANLHLSWLSKATSLLLRKFSTNYIKSLGKTSHHNLPMPEKEPRLQNFVASAMSYIFGPSPGSLAAHIQLPEAWPWETPHGNSADFFCASLPVLDLHGKKTWKKKSQNGAAFFWWCILLVIFPFGKKKHQLQTDLSCVGLGEENEHVKKTCGKTTIELCCLKLLQVNWAPLQLNSLATQNKNILFSIILVVL